MAITIDEFLRDLTERELLSTEEAYTVRRQLTANAPFTPHPEKAEPGSSSREQSATMATPASLVLCDCLVQDKLQDDEHHLVFNANRLRDDSAVTIHVLVPGYESDKTIAPKRLNGTAPNMGEHPARPRGITDVGRHGDMVAVCCESLEAETLEQLVLQNGILPLELATETLLQTARTLKRLQEQGLALQEVSAEWLLLDEDGRVHLMGGSPSQFLSTRTFPNGDEEPRRQPLHESLGQLYGFLQTGRIGSDSSPESPFRPSPDSTDPETETRLLQSAKLVHARLLGKAATSPYPHWDELIQDLECLLEGRELPAPAHPPLADVPTERRESVSASDPVVEEAASSKSKASRHTALWIGIALAVLAGVILVAVYLLKD